MNKNSKRNIFLIFFLSLQLFLTSTARAEQATYEQTLAAAEQGNADAQNALGVLYYSGQLGENKAYKAIMWHKKAAASGYGESYLALARMKYEDGNLKEARALGKQAVAHGSTDARDFLSVIPKDKTEEPKNAEEAFRLYKKQAKEGDRDAQYELANIYLNMGNEKEGVKWMEEAAAQGHPAAEYLLNKNQNYHEVKDYRTGIFQQQRYEVERLFRQSQDFGRDMYWKLGR